MPPGLGGTLYDIEWLSCIHTGNGEIQQEAEGIHHTDTVEMLVETLDDGLRVLGDILVGLLGGMLHKDGEHHRKVLGDSRE